MARVLSVCVFAIVTLCPSRQQCGDLGGLWCWCSGPGCDYGDGYEVQAEKRQR